MMIYERTKEIISKKGFVTNKKWTQEAELVISEKDLRAILETMNVMTNDGR